MKRYILINDRKILNELGILESLAYALHTQTPVCMSTHKDPGPYAHTHAHTSVHTDVSIHMYIYVCTQWACV